jgi:hypothetical protein
MKYQRPICKSAVEGLLMKKFVLIFTLVLGFSCSAKAQTWKFVQDGVLTEFANCAGRNSCSIGTPNGNIIPTVAGSIWILRIHTNVNVSITSVTGGGGTWHLCSGCHLWNAATSDDQDLAYNLTGNAGANTVTVNLSGSAGSYLGGNFIEILPPSGSTASFVTANTSTASSGTTLTAPTLTLSGTDAVVEVLSGTGALGVNAFSSGYVTDYASDGIGLNITSGTGPTVHVTGSTGGDITAIAFTSSQGSFSPPSGSMSPVQFVNNPTGTGCSPSCSLSVASTGAGNLIYVEAVGGGAYISSGTVGGTSLTVPTGCRGIAGGISVSCGYTLSSPSGATSLNVTMTGSGSVAFGFWEIHSNSGTFAFDTLNSTSNSASYIPQGAALTLNGPNDAIFQTISEPGGPSAVSYYPLGIASNGNNSMILQNYNAATGVLLNASTAPTPYWTNEQNNPTSVTGVAFSSGTGTVGGAPAPPTGLAAVVN